MLPKLLKLLGLDVAAKVEAVTAGLELRLEQASEHIRQVAREATAVAVLFALAAFAGAMAVAVGLIALYLWTADAFGPYVGLGAVAGILIVITGLLLTAAIVKRRSLPSYKIKLPRYGSAADAESEPDLIKTLSAVDGGAALGQAPTAKPAASGASASDLVEPVAFLLSKVAKVPSGGSPIDKELIENSDAASLGAASAAIDRAANVVRHGDRKELTLVLFGAALVGWLITRRARR
ncbi:hypothetical protein [Methylocapsa aurea]|uniref:hypothetical protein n=1 Tax=Methylocapsa aurea TaxID=663610 RepID=UPI00068C3D89|nr:hypothetical protein [Methylocapsa aurea]